MWKALAWIMLLRPRAMATWPFQKIRSPLCRPARLADLPSALSCMSLSRGHLMPHAVSATCTRPEQSRPRLDLPPQRYGAPTKSLGHRDEIRLDRGERREMALRHEAARRGDGKALLLPRHGELCAERQRIGRRQLDRRPGKHQGPQRRHLVRRRGPRREQRRRRQPADIAVGFELAPGPALLVGLVDRHALAAQRLGEQRRVVRRLLPQRREADDHLLLRAFDEARRLDLAAQMRGREIGPRGGDSRIEVRCHHPFANGTMDSLASAPGM